MVAVLANWFAFHELHDAWKELFMTLGVSRGKLVSAEAILYQQKLLSGASCLWKYES